MNLRLSCLALAVVCLTVPLAAQTANTTAAPATATVPRLITFSGTLSHTAAEPGENGVILAPGTAPTHVLAITFSLYSEQAGGAPLWSEVQNVHVDGSGRYTVQLGASQPDGLPMGIFTSVQAQWLGVQPEGQAEQARVMVVSVPYALKAADAETFGGKPPSAYALSSPSDANTSSGASAVPGNGAGTSKNPLHPLPISGSGTTNYVPLWTNASNLASSAIYQDPVHGYIGIGNTSPAASLDVENNSFFPIIGSTNNGALPAMTGLNLSTSGTAPGVSGSSSSAAGIGVFGDASSTSGAAFGVEGTTTTPNGAGVYGVVNGSNADGVAGINEATTGPATGVLGSSASPSGAALYGTNTATFGSAVGVKGLTASTGGAAVWGIATSTSGSGYGVQGSTDSPYGDGVYGVANSTDPSATSYGVYGQTASPSGAGVYGTNTATSGNAFGVFGQSASGYGVYGKSATGVAILGSCVPTGSNTCSNGVAGINTSTSGGMNGVYALTDSPDGSAVYMVNTKGGSLLVGTESNGGNATFYVQANGSGYFGGAVQIDGNLNVGGTLTKGGGSFKIDDPIDPANKYLSHSFVESPDMMNIYNGNVTTDKRGLATVVLPDYFEVLNRDFRYQLTVIGQFAQAIIAKEINGGRFTIRTNKPGVKVSWQVTGIRHDAWANAHRIPTEEEKPLEKRGTYLYPELYGERESEKTNAMLQH